MTNVWMVRAEFGKFSDQFVAGGYAAIGWLHEQDLSGVATREGLLQFYKATYPKDKDSRVGINVGQIERFLLKIQAGDYVVTSPIDSRWLHYGKVIDPYFYQPGNNDGCPFPHRRRVDWSKDRIRRSELSPPFQNSLKGQLTVFAIRHQEEFLTVIGENIAPPPPPSVDPYSLVLSRLLELDAVEFEYLVGDLMTTIGFEDPKVTPQTNDNGVDVIGELDLQGLASVRLVVQVKRYKRGNNITVKAIRQFRADIPVDYQGAFITSSSFQAKARDEAEKEGFKRIYLLDGRQLVELLNKHWEDLLDHWNRTSKASDDSGSDFGFEEKLGLKRGLVLA